VTLVHKNKQHGKESSNSGKSQNKEHKKDLGFFNCLSVASRDGEVASEA
jgi:hypothetical protein